MRRIIYFCPNVGAPIGGIKVIHRHSELINQIGGASCIYYHVGATENKINWFTHNAAIKSDNVFIPEFDFVVLPESLIFSFWKELKALKIDYGIFIQNGYLIRNGIPTEELEECYLHAKFLICISEDAINCVFEFFPQHFHKIIRVSTSVDKEVFKIGEKNKIITYMPRKVSDHSTLLIPMLRRRLPAEWRIIAIDRMSELQVAELLSTSRIFLAFTDFEGLGLPAIEAAFCGNFVIGYTGQGGNEFWNRPVFNRIDQGDIGGFLNTTVNKVLGIEENNLAITETHLTFINELYSKEMEINLIKRMMAAIS